MTPRCRRASVSGRCRFAICFGAWQECQLPDPGITDARPWRSAGDGGVASFSPESWTSDLSRLKRAGVSVEYRTARTKPEIALAEIDRVTAAGVRFGCVLADAGYGLSAPLRHGLTARNLARTVRIPRHLKVYPVDVRLAWPVAKRGRPRRRSVRELLMPAEDMLANAKWQTVSWRTGTKGKLKARFAAVRIRIADGPPQRIRDKGQQHLPRIEAG